MVKSSSPSPFIKVELIAMVKVMMTLTYCQKVEADFNVDDESNDQLSTAYIHKVPRSMYMMTMQIDHSGEGQD